MCRQTRASHPIFKGESSMRPVNARVLMIKTETWLENDWSLCKARLKFMSAMNSVGAKEVNYVQMESTSRGITAIFG